MTDWDRPDYGSDLSLLDTVLIVALGFILLFLAAWLQIRPPTESDRAVKMRAEFVLTMTWPDGAFDDVDLWLMVPDGRKVFFRQREVDYVTLDRDDLGIINDFYTDGSGKRAFTPSNREMMTIRAFVPGRYIVAAHVYAQRTTQTDYMDGKVWQTVASLPYAATLEVVKLNPALVEVLKSTVQLSEHGQEAVFAAFDVDAEGNVTGVELNPSAYKIVDLIPFYGVGQ